MLTIRFATAADLSAIKGLWSRCFPEDREVSILSFLACVNLESECLLGCVNQQPVCMLFLLPAQWAGNESSCLLRYVYAVATHPQHRRNGYSSKLLEAAGVIAKRDGVSALYLLPATPDLYRYYARLGYRSLFSVCCVEGDADVPADVCDISIMSAKQYTTRRSWLPLQLDARFTEYAVKAAERSGGGAFCIKQGHIVSFALCERLNDTVLIKELLSNEETDNGIICRAVADHLKCSRYTCRMPATDKNETEPFGMIYYLEDSFEITDAVPYLGLALD